MIGKYDFLDTHWYWTSYAYADEATAEKAWENLARVAGRHRGAHRIGFYRHGSSQSGMVIVTALGLEKTGVSYADRALGAQAFHGFEDEPPEDVLQALIARRVRVVHEMSKEGLAPGSYMLRRPEGQHINPDGTFE